MNKALPIFNRIIAPNFQQIRQLPRWTSRNPVRVIDPEDYDPKNDREIRPKQIILDESHEAPVNRSQSDFKINWKRPKQLDMRPKNQTKQNVEKPLTIRSGIQKSKKLSACDMLETTVDAEGNFIYTKMGNNDNRVGRLLAQIKSNREKGKNDLMLLEGKRLILDALTTNCKLKYILFSRLNDLEYLKQYLPKYETKLYKMPYHEMQMWSDLVTTPGIMGVFQIPNTLNYNVKDAIPLTVICDNIREPTNLGAILRVCAGVGCEKVLLTKGCVNPWESKVLRSASGAHFKIQLHRKLTWETIKECIPQNSNIYVADNKLATGDKEDLANLVDQTPVVPYFSINFNKTIENFLIIGGETEGLSEESFNLAAEFNGVRLHVPLSNNLDSLNTGTALAIIAFEIKKQIISGLVNSNDLVKKEIHV